MKKIDDYKLNEVVTEFLDTLNHPLQAEIEYLRKLIMSTVQGLAEGIKWNGPNYSLNNEDRITIKINPQKNQIQVIFHRGAKVKEQPQERLLKNEYSILTWKENDRAIATLKNIDEIEQCSTMLKEIVSKWIEATM